MNRKKGQSRQRCTRVYGVNFTDCLRLSGVSTELRVEGSVIAAHRIYGAWMAFLQAEGKVTGETVTITTKKGRQRHKPVIKRPTLLTVEADSLALGMFEWITTSYGEAYRSIKTDEERTWLQTIIRFVVYQRLMENKYHAWITSGSGFADETVACTMAEVYRFRAEMPELARLIHATLLVHKDREAEDWQKRLAEEVIEGVFERLRVDRLRTLPPVEKSVQIEGGAL
jgi:hypothetical protein